MTHPKTPIALAVEALNQGCEIYFQWYYTPSEPESGGMIAYTLVSIMRQALADLRASTGKMKPAEEWAIEISNAIHGIDEEHRTADEDELDCILEVVKRLQAENALTAQPEPRPLKELIAEGCEEFWVWVDGAHPRWFMRDKSWADECVIIGREGMLDCPALPIWKPKNV